VGAIPMVSKTRGFSLIETMVSTLILAVAITGMFSLWNVCSTSIHHSGEINAAGQIARAELERAKVYGASNFPTGVYSSGRQTGSWMGTFDPTANSGAGGWVSDGISYYDYQGVRLTSSSGAAFSIQLSVTDSNVLPATTGTSYAIDFRSRRAVVATVTQLRDNTVLFRSGTNLVVGGI
jgi:prepilin-type N-terminal cleavage/methylation domain-containing protein